MREERWSPADVAIYDQVSGVAISPQLWRNSIDLNRLTSACGGMGSSLASNYRGGFIRYPVCVIYPIPPNRLAPARLDVLDPSLNACASKCVDFLAGNAFMNLSRAKNAAPLPVRVAHTPGSGSRRRAFWRPWRDACRRLFPHGGSRPGRHGPTSGCGFSELFSKFLLQSKAIPW